MVLKNKSGKRLIQSVVRTLSILNCFEKNEELQISEISAAVGIGKSTAHHLLATLKEMNFVQQDEQTKGYSLGIQIFKLGYSYFNQLNLVKVARPYLKELCSSTKETVHLGELFGSAVLYLDKIESPLSITMRSKIGATKPAYCTGIGKILLAFQSEDELKKLIDELVLEPYTDNTITDKNILYEKLMQYKAQGYSIDDEEIETGLFCIAAPIYDVSGKVVAAISLSAPKYRISDRLDALIPEVKRVALKISNTLGYMGKQYKISPDSSGRKY
ncbi:MAG: IclR family transcriptional regulator [Thermodesulfobacteriota bacterium]